MYTDIETANERITQLEDRVAELDDQISGLKDEIGGLESDLRAVTEDKNDLRGALDEALPDLREALRVLERVK
jgi:predicted  nucleic acid-binding Zn-ribbon protein